MDKPAPRTRRVRGSIDPEKILDGAFEIAERDGIDGLSMPILAAHLDVGVTSIYWYFRNKEELLRRMSARAMTAIQRRMKPIEAPPEEWRTVLGEWMRTQRRVYLESDLDVEMTLIRTAAHSRPTTHLVYDNVESTLRYLVSAGFGLAAAWQVFSACSIYVRGFVLAEHSRRVNEIPPLGLAQLSLLDPETMPLLTRLVVEENAMIDNAGDREFESGLGLLLDAAERTRER